MRMRTLFWILCLLLTLEAGERIVSLSPSLSEIIFALQKGEELVGVSDYSLFPPEVQKLPIVGGYSNPNREKIIALQPSLVVGQDFNQETLESLERFNIKTVMLKLQTIEDIKSSILKLANLLHAKPDTLIQAIDEALKNAPKAKKSHTVMIVYGLHEDLRSGIYVAGGEIFFDDIILACGNTNTYKNTQISQPVLSYENVIALNPEQIIILHSRASNPHANEQKALEAWYALPTKASQNGQISIVDESYAHIPSHRVALTIERLCKEMNHD